MCGIAGWIARDGRSPHPSRLYAMRQALSHRGPDGWGEHIVGSIALAHTRLAIIDPSGGAQPLLRDTHALVEGDVLAAWPPVAGG